jgi:hypothetical protein
VLDRITVLVGQPAGRDGRGNNIHREQRFSVWNTKMKIMTRALALAGVLILSGGLSSIGHAEEQEPGILFLNEPSAAAPASAALPATKPQPVAQPVLTTTALPPHASPKSKSSLTSATLAADDPALALADAAGGKTQFLTLSQQVLNQLVRQQPELARHEKTVLAWGRDALTWDKMRVELATTYHQYFSPAEIKDMNVFFSSPAGQKWLRYGPLLKEQTIMIGQRLAKADQPRLLLMLQQEGQH